MRMQQYWPANSTETKVGMTILNWILNYHVYEHVGFIIGLKIGKKEIRQIDTLHVLPFTRQRAATVNCKVSRKQYQ